MMFPIPNRGMMLLAAACVTFLAESERATAQAVYDTTRSDTTVIDISIGYESVLQQYAQLRRIEEAGEVGGAQDGLQRAEIDGLVVDETTTKLGRDFYVGFYAAWQAPEGALNFTVAVQEQPMPGIGTRVTVRVNDEIAFQSRLQPRQEFIETAARRAVYLTHRFVQGLASREEYVY